MSCDAPPCQQHRQREHCRSPAHLVAERADLVLVEHHLLRVGQPLEPLERGRRVLLRGRDGSLGGVRLRRRKRCRCGYRGHGASLSPRAAAVRGMVDALALGVQRSGSALHAAARCSRAAPSATPSGEQRPRQPAEHDARHALGRGRAVWASPFFYSTLTPFFGASRSELAHPRRQRRWLCRQQRRRPRRQRQPQEQPAAR